jgi:hypothetical protein
MSGIKNRDAPMDEVIQEVGDRRVQYGRLVDEDEADLVIAEPKKIRPVSTIGSPKLGGSPEPNRMNAIFENDK